MDEAELQEIMDLLQDASEAWELDNTECYGGTHLAAQREAKRKRFAGLVTRLVRQQRQQQPVLQHLHTMIDPSVPRSEIHFRDRDGRIVGKITGIANTEDEPGMWPMLEDEAADGRV